jgi:hypothetical protein
MNRNFRAIAGLASHEGYPAIRTPSGVKHWRGAAGTRGRTNTSFCPCRAGREMSRIWIGCLATCGLVVGTAFTCRPCTAQDVFGNAATGRPGSSLALLDLGLLSRCGIRKANNELAHEGNRFHCQPRAKHRADQALEFGLR